MSDYEKYFKIIYRSEPIGKEKIILELMTFDIEAFERQKTLKEIPAKTVSQEFYISKHSCIPNQDYMQYLEKQLNNKIDDFYKKEIERLKKSLEANRIMTEARRIEYTKIIKGNITNSDNIVCDIIQGNVVNCDNVKVREIRGIRGNIVNCEIYKE